MGRTTFLLAASPALAAFALGAASCGARTELGAPIIADATSEDHHDADANVDVADVIEDEGNDVVFPDVPIITNCADAGTTYIYVITEQNELYSFYPPTLAFTKIGTISCTQSATPFSMGVDRSGIAYSVFGDGNLFQISTLNAACKATPFVPNQHGFQTFGMGFSGAADAGETLYVSQTASSEPQLGWIDTKTFQLNVIGFYKPQKSGRCELTGTGDGRLFAFCVPVVGTGGELVNLDPATAAIISEISIPVGGSQDAFAYAFWGGEFWLFTGPPGNPTTVSEFDPIALTTKTVATLGSTIVGAGVSTCAPEK